MFALAGGIVMDSRPRYSLWVYIFKEISTEN